MSEKDDVFTKSLTGVKPLDKSNKISKPVPKSPKIYTKREVLKPTLKQKLKSEPLQKQHPKTLSLEKNKTNKRLKKGKIPIDKRIDFHGCSLEEAQSIFFKTIEDCFYKNKRCILFITGKGSSGRLKENFEQKKLYYGKIRKNFLDWLSKKEVEGKILNIQQASIKYGGDGAFFVYLRKNKN